MILLELVEAMLVARVTLKVCAVVCAIMLAFVGVSQVQNVEFLREFVRQRFICC